jgi:hypothetical protein
MSKKDLKVGDHVSFTTPNNPDKVYETITYIDGSHVEGRVYDLSYVPNLKKELIHPDELEFIYYKRGAAGSFRTGLYDLFFKADTQNRMRLIMAFPYLWVIESYANKEGYWKDLQERFKKKMEDESSQLHP